MTNWIPKGTSQWQGPLRPLHFLYPAYELRIRPDSVQRTAGEAFSLFSVLK